MLKNEVILKAETKKGHTVHGTENIMSYTLLQLSKWALRHIKQWNQSEQKEIPSMANSTWQQPA